MEEKESIFSFQAFFSGHVQGVGFRYTTLQVAKEYEVTGFVRNLLDGRVELVAEGTKSECRSFLKSVQDNLDSYIRKTELSDGLGAKRFDSFRIS